jgi:triosephosphate isomerase
MKKYILFNFKNNPQTTSQLKELLKIYRTFDTKITKKFQIVLLPPDIYLPLIKEQSIRSIHLGAQDVFWFNKIQATGEITPAMLKFLGVEHIILGHSERRRYFEENGKIINLKIKACFANKLVPVLCVGEKDKSRDGLVPDFETKQEIFEELNYAFRGIKLTKTTPLMIAYEPVWAIGKDTAQDVAGIEAVVSLIRFWLCRRFADQIANKIPILYGGSVDHRNIQSILASKQIAGVLIGGASTNKIELTHIIKTLKNINK